MGFIGLWDTLGRKDGNLLGCKDVNNRRAFINRIINSNSFKRAIRFSGVTRLLNSSTIKARFIMFNFFPLGNLPNIITIFLYSAFILLQNRLLNLNKKKYINSWHKIAYFYPLKTNSNNRGRLSVRGNRLLRMRSMHCTPVSTSRNTRNCILAASPSILAYPISLLKAR